MKKKIKKMVLCNSKIEKRVMPVRLTQALNASGPGT